MKYLKSSPHPIYTIVDMHLGLLHNRKFTYLQDSSKQQIDY
jgi:hypothetical protein